MTDLKEIDEIVERSLGDPSEFVERSLPLATAERVFWT